MQRGGMGLLGVRAVERCGEAGAPPPELLCERGEPGCGSCGAMLRCRVRGVCESR